MTDKPALRETILKARDALSFKQREEKSVEIQSRLIALPEYREAQTLFIYADFRSEVMTRGLMDQAIRDGKRLLASKTLVLEKKLLLTDILDPERDLVAGYMGIPEPREEIIRDISCEEADLILTPCVGYDEGGNRLGYGGGYYDRLFEQTRKDAVKIGLAFEVQIVPQVPCDTHDIQIPIIVTEERVIRV